MWLKQPGRQVGPEPLICRLFVLGLLTFCDRLAFGGFVALRFGLGGSIKLHFSLLEAHSSILALTFGYLFFPCSFFFFFPVFIRSLELGGISFWRSGSLIRWVEWIVWDWGHTLNTAQRVSERMSEIHGMQMNRNLNNDILKMIRRAWL